MKLNRMLKQSSLLPTWVGGVLMQLQMSLIYISLLNVIMLSVTVWYTSVGPIVHNYLPSVSIFHFLVIMMLFWSLIILTDYKFLTPAKQRYTNRQSAVHENPALDALYEVRADVKSLKKDIEEIKSTIGMKGKEDAESKG